MPTVQDIIKNSKFIQDSKRILIEDAVTQLEGSYGLLTNGTFENISNLPNLKEGSVDLAVRKELEQYIKIQRDAGKTTPQAFDNLVKEYAFTYLNRFVAIKMMEDRKIIKQSFSRGYESNNFIFYMADHPEDETNFKRGNGYSAYRNFVLWLFTDLSKDEEIKILFDPSSINSQLFPLERTLKSLFEILNNKLLNEVWKEDEVIGWVYQYFIEDEKAKVFHKIYKDKKKLDLRDIPAATQIFTPKWIVKYIVENTLGRLWLRMHPDSKVRQEMKYFVPNNQDKDLIELKPIKEITLLDPACGTMHFGMYAFDLFYLMYLEEIENTGKDGWLNEPSVKEEKEIAKSIIENNIYGIDIDLRAIQLSALSLYLKAKTKNKNVHLDKYNLTHTDIPTFDDKTIKEFVDQLTTKHAVTKKLLKEILPQLNKAYYLGSLLKIEEVVDSFVEREKVSIKRELPPDLFGFYKEGQTELDLYTEKKIIWEDVREEIISSLEAFADTHSKDTSGYLAGESIKGVNFINALIKKHSVVVANPPYSGRRNWPTILKNDLKNIYGKLSGDLYTCFIDRCISLTSQEGLSGLVTIHSFMFTSSHEQVRNRILLDTQIETMVHLGTKTEFEVANKTAQGFVMYSLFKRNGKVDNTVGVYFRLVNENEEEKQRGFIDSLDFYNGRSKVDNGQCFSLSKNKLKVIPGWPFVYWISEELRSLFTHQLLGSVAEARQGMTTLENTRFIRFVWEQPFTYSESSKWKLYSKGGEVNRWYGNLYYCVNWEPDAIKVYKSSTNRSIILSKNSKDYLDKQAVGYTFLTVSNFSGRLFPGGAFDIGGSCIFARKIDILILMGILNSKISTYLLKIINPTVNQQVGDIEKIPLPKLIPENQSENLKGLVGLCIDLKKYEYNTREISWEFNGLLGWDDHIKQLLNLNKELSLKETEISKIIYSLYNLREEQINEIESEVGKLSGDMEKVMDLSNKRLAVIKDYYLEKHIPAEALAEFDEEESENTDDETDDKKSRGKQSRFLTFEEICLASGFHPETVYNYIVENKLEREEERYELAVRWISYAVGILMGRFNYEGIEADDDGICVLDEGHSDDLPKNVYQALEILLNEKEAKEVIETINEGPTDNPIDVLRKFLNREFFITWHIPMYKKRPVYWLLQSSKKNYGFYLYNLKFNNTSLYQMVEKYINPKIQLEKNSYQSLFTQRDIVTDSKEKRRIENLLSRSEELVAELEEFKKNVQEVIDLKFQPDIDDGVILNMAPLYKLIPWKEPEKFYKELQKGNYEWSTVSKQLFQKK
ncbi:MAG: hypothetical protein DAHOPDDO_03371 [Ignavibacteriaceae bacterium]|nr:hypothetical protein [Ignavibacteriaceae bacterium]